jgi:hypothetical protein
MHLNNRPVYFTKGSRRTAAYYTVQVRELLADGWTQEQPQIPDLPVESTDVAAEQPVETAYQEQQDPESDEPAKELGDMTKAELIAYAEANGIEFKQYATKSEILEACQATQNG